MEPLKVWWTLKQVSPVWYGSLGSGHGFIDPKFYSATNEFSHTFCSRYRMLTQQWSNMLISVLP
jgi:hypothetical protein